MKERTEALTKLRFGLQRAEQKACRESVSMYKQTAYVSMAGEQGGALPASAMNSNTSVNTQQTSWSISKRRLDITLSTNQSSTQRTKTEDQKTKPTLIEARMRKAYRISAPPLTDFAELR